MSATWECPYCGEGKEEHEHACYPCRHEMSLAWDYITKAASEDKTMVCVREYIGATWPRADKILRTMWSQFK